jgi:hypothetical protein
MASMTYTERNTLMRRGAVDQEPDVEVNTFLLGDRSIANFEEGHGRYGCDWVGIIPAWVEGSRAFLIQQTRSPAAGYNAEGTEETIISFEEGVRLFLEKGLFEALVPKS